MFDTENNLYYQQRRLENDRISLEIFDKISNTPHPTAENPLRALDARHKHAPRTNSNTCPSQPPSTPPQISQLTTTDPVAPSPQTACTPSSPQDTHEYAGTIALETTSRKHASTELAIVIFPQFHRTYVASHAIGLLLLYVLDPPAKGGLGLRRVVWRCHWLSEASRRVAERMGFVFEGVMRWERVLEGGRVRAEAEELGRRNGTGGKEGVGRHSVVLSVVWDEWEVKRGMVVEQMERRK
ncbi:uncharacterized protein LY89DRAFT_721205 [Mollisia scopiformis]|uniref:N-acetyltransferase domain-containing protein n=1 Tax=Mollisia scopiformis TaxID=149040 RepID=A0A194X1M6_MOLSC|nr:uncharacterized protein LY89DRAFT_721205 [Mollisia scopiformis]KUJ14093.1 hypothetical protein LY89DRAFT_721205 [Mollisia scopiformis]